MGFIKRLQNAWEIFKTSIAFIGRDKSLLAVPALMVVAGIGLCVLFLLMLPWMLISPGRFPLIILGFVILAQFIMNFLGAMQCWMVHEVARGKDATVASGFGRALKETPDIIIYSIVFLILSCIPRKKNGGIGALIYNLFVSILQVFITIAGKLILPAMIITERTFWQSVKQLKQAMKAWPEILLFEVGVRPLMGLLFGVGFIITLFTFFISPVIAIVFFVFLILAEILLSVFINNTYYTLLYISLIEKKNVKGLKLPR